MSTATNQQMTLEEFRKLPEDPAVERELLNGMLYEWFSGVVEKDSMTRRIHRHAEVEANVAFLLKQFVKSQPSVIGKVYSGEVGCELLESNSSVGIDVAFYATDQLPTEEDVYITGAPLVAVDILSPSDVLKNLQAKVKAYLVSGTQQVWIIDPHFKTVTIYRPDRRPEMFSEGQQFSCEPALTGLTINVDDIFS